jgi:hypothetical protein
MTDETVLAETPAAETVVDPKTNEQAAPETVVEETPEAADTAEPAVEETNADAEDDGGEKKKIPGSQRLKRKLALIESDFANVLRENEELKRRVPAPQEQRQDGRPGIEREPTEADFPNDYFAYERSRTAWEVRQSVRDEIARAQQIPQQVRQAEAQRERLIAYEESAELVRERIPDFDKVIRTAADVTIKPELIQELLASDKSALLQYHLAKNPDKARELERDERQGAGPRTWPAGSPHSSADAEESNRCKPAALQVEGWGSRVFRRQQFVNGRLRGQAKGRLEGLSITLTDCPS